MFYSIIYGAALVSLVSAHGVILAVQGEPGSPQGIGFQVNAALARNCTTISPCQQDTAIIRDAEITSNLVNECGRTELGGNIDVGENTENQLSAGTVTQVKSGTQMTVTLHQVNADGAGPYSCDLDEQGNAGTLSQNLTVTNNVPGVNGLSQGKTQDFNMTVTMPANFTCSGASTGNICTVRCRNNAIAGPFGGCFAVQQTDVTPNVNSANQINTAQTLDGVMAQIAQNQKDLPAAVAANQNFGSDEGVQALDSANKLLGVTVTSRASPTQTLAANIAANNVAAAATTTAAATKASTAASAGNGAGAAAAKGAGKGAAGAAGGKGAGAAAAAAAAGKKDNKRSFGPSMKFARRMFSGEN